MNWIFLSPHLDDVIFSCGALIWDLVQEGSEVSIWTICAGDPPREELSDFARALERSWGIEQDPLQTRREEDQQACRILGVTPRYLSYLDCIYRLTPEGEFYYDSEEALFAGLDPREFDLINKLSAELEKKLPPEVNLVAPLGIGNHVDHDLTRKAANRLNRQICFYPDYPYAREPDGIQILEYLGTAEDWKKTIYPVSERAQNKWHQSVNAYTSQLPVFWENEIALKEDIRQIIELYGGITLWETIEED
jgi:LmbE family N-acetylglucosaminyl deacetylase